MLENGIKFTKKYFRLWKFSRCFRLTATVHLLKIIIITFNLTFTNCSKSMPKAFPDLYSCLESISLTLYDNILVTFSAICPIVFSLRHFVAEIDPRIQTFP